MSRPRRSWIVPVVLIGAACGGSPTPQGPASATGGRDSALTTPGRQVPVPADPPMLGVHWARGSAPGGSSPNMTWHSGAVMTATDVQPIFWGTTWSGRSDEVTGLDTFYGGFAGSAYAQTTHEYTGSNGSVGWDAVSYLGHLLDGSQAPSNAPRTAAVLAEVCKMIQSPVANGYYPVYVDTPRNHAAYCAWHSYGTCGTTPVQFGFFFLLDGDPGCDPQDDPTVTGHSQGLAALANVSGHEVSETLTDPRSGGWYDSSGQENADKCVWTFGGPYVVFTDGTKWKIQGNWSNAAYTASSGYPNGSGQDGCVDGTNVPAP